MKALITGGTGFIGKRLVSKLPQEIETIYLLTRPKSIEKAKSALGHIKNIKFIIGDITQDEVIEKYSDLEEIKSNVDTIINIAGNYNLEVTEFEAYKHNVIGVQNVINLAKTIKNLNIFHHISTYAVVGTMQGNLSEDDLDDAKNFKDFYARSKMQGENILRHANLNGTKLRIYRPGIVIGSSQDGEIEKIDGPYYLMKFLYKNKDIIKHLKMVKKIPFPFHKDACLPLIPVDYLCLWLEHALKNPTEHKLRSYNLLSDNPVSVEKFTGYLLQAYGINADLISLKESRLYNHVLPKLGMPKELLSYMYSSAKFEVDHRKLDFPDLPEFSMNEICQNLLTGSKQYFEERI